MSNGALSLRVSQVYMSDQYRPAAARALDIPESSMQAPTDSYHREAKI